MDVRGEGGRWGGGVGSGHEMARLPNVLEASPSFIEGWHMQEQSSDSWRGSSCFFLFVYFSVSFCVCLSILLSFFCSDVLSSLPPFLPPSSCSLLSFFSTQPEYNHLRHENNCSSPNRVQTSLMKFR